jgi:hypothetical protein
MTLAPGEVPADLLARLVAAESHQSPTTTEKAGSPSSVTPGHYAEIWRAQHDPNMRPSGPQLLSRRFHRRPGLSLFVHGRGLTRTLRIRQRPPSRRTVHRFGCTMAAWEGGEHPALQPNPSARSVVEGRSSVSLGPHSRTSSGRWTSRRILARLGRGSRPEAPPRRDPCRLPRRREAQIEPRPRDTRRSRYAGQPKAACRCDIRHHCNRGWLGPCVRGLRCRTSLSAARLG